MQDNFQDFDEHIDEDVEMHDFSPNGHAENKQPQGPQKQSGDVYYEFTISPRSVRDTGRKLLKASETALHTGLAVDDFVERRRQVKRQKRRQNMSDGLRLVSFLTDVFL